MPRIAHQRSSPHGPALPEDVFGSMPFAHQLQLFREANEALKIERWRKQ